MQHSVYSIFNQIPIEDSTHAKTSKDVHKQRDGWFTQLRHYTGESQDEEQHTKHNTNTVTVTVGLNLILRYQP